MDENHGQRKHLQKRDSVRVCADSHTVLLSGIRTVCPGPSGEELRGAGSDRQQADCPIPPRW